ncbi:MAG: DUF1080 domain-containing protein [Planctomycetota bacterium]|nr:DUF1080 domain-containing protein [Planctomycetota bacterium]
MRVLSALALFLAAVGCSKEAPVLTAVVQPGVLLFDGESLAGWSGDTSYWSVEDGCIVGRSTAEHLLERSTYLFWEGEAQDFILDFDYRIAGGNSGIQYRSARLPDDDVFGYQADIEDGPSYTGILYESGGRAIVAERGTRVQIAHDGVRSLGDTLGTAEDLQAQVKSGDWNHYRITARGTRLIHEVNGVTMVDVSDRENGRARARGTFALQLHQGPPMEVRFRGIRLQALPLQGAPEAEWIWSAGDSPSNETRRFVREFELAERATVVGGAIAGDNHFRAWLDGEEIARGDDWSQPVAIQPGKELAEGQHVLAIEGLNDGGPAAIAARLLLRSGEDTPIALVTDHGWMAYDVMPEVWPATSLPDGGTPIYSYGPVSAHRGPWGAVMAERVATPADRFTVPPGFAAELIHSASAAEGSWVAMTFGPKGEIYVSPQQGALQRVHFPNGHDAAPVVEILDTPAGSAQGLLWAHDALYVNAQGGPDGGLQRLRDRDGDGVFEEHAVLKRYGPPGEHGPHGIVLGPDGMLYLTIGNHVALPEGISPNSPFRNGAEDVLLERLWDPRGHAVGVMAPGGTVLRTDPDGKNWEVMFAGLRNAYDLAFAPNGELFTYDSDMEWDIGAPWYRAPRVVHVVPGGENGWRSGSAKWPAQYPDSLPPVVETGPSSPTGTVFGTGGNFPGAWREALYIADWAYGRISAVHLTPKGASYGGSVETFISGKPMNVADLEFGPDGALWFITGGRGTQSGLYRVRWLGGAEFPPKLGSFEDETPEFSLRQDLGRADNENALSLAIRNLDHEDPFVRLAARLIVERSASQSLQSTYSAGLAISQARRGMNVDLEALQKEWWKGADRRWAVLRAWMLAWMRLPDTRAELRASCLPLLRDALPSGDPLLDREIAALLVAVEAPGLPTLLLERLRVESYAEGKLHYAMLLRLVKSDWTDNQRVELLTWLRSARLLPGGFSLIGFYDAIEREFLAAIPVEQAAALLAQLPDAPPTAEYAPAEVRAFVRKWSVAEAVAALATNGAPDLDHGARLFEAVGCIQCHRIDGRGGSVGPDLSSAGSRFAQRDLLEAIIEPQKFVSDQYTILPMPAGLADSLNAAELRDLTRWLEARVAR